MSHPKELQNIKKIAVFGMGVSGVAAIKLLVSAGFEVHAVNRGEPQSWSEYGIISGLISSDSMHAEEASQRLFRSSDLIILSPGIARTHKALEGVEPVKIISEIELAYWFCKVVPVIGITGTNGKTTTTTMIEEALMRAGKRVFCGGNIGTPYSEMAIRILNHESFDYAVIELSSFQLESIEHFKPQIALMLNLTENHSERYESLDDYGKAKLNILKNMTRDEHLIVGFESGKWLLWSQSFPVQKHLFGKENLPSEFSEKFDFKKSRLVGKHNRANFFCAWKLLELLGLSSEVDFQSFIHEFKGVPHRLEFVCEFHGLKIYNDAKSTNAQSIKTALEAFSGEDNLYLVMGGKLRSETDSFIETIRPFKIKKIFTIGMTGDRLREELKNDFAVEVVGTIEKLSEVVKESQFKGVLVFSPGHPSFDQFKNYVDRGEKFVQLFKNL